MENKFLTVSGYCPVFNIETDVEIKYIQPPATTGYKAVSCECDLTDDCPENICPILIEHAFI